MAGRGKDHTGDGPAAASCCDARPDVRREARLGSALRQNLHRRKARARALQASDATAAGAPDAPDTPAKDP